MSPFGRCHDLALSKQKITHAAFLFAEKSEAINIAVNTSLVFGHYSEDLYPKFRRYGRKMMNHGQMRDNEISGYDHRIKYLLSVFVLTMRKEVHVQQAFLLQG